MKAIGVLIYFSVIKVICCIKVLSTNSTSVSPGRKGQAELLNSSLFEREEFTICLRFKTFTFITFPDSFSYQVILSYRDIWMFASYVAIPCDQRLNGCTQFYKDLLGQEWKHGKVLGYSRYGVGDNNQYYSLLRPGSWNSLCVSASVPRKMFSVSLNGVLVFRTDSYEGMFSSGDTNLVLMNDGGDLGDVPLHGAVTDVNIWGEVLSAQQVQDWAACSSTSRPDILAWQDSRLRTRDLLLLQLDVSETCLRPAEKEYKALQTKKNFQDSRKFCRKLGGSMAEVGDSQSLEAVQTAVQETCGHAALFYTGHTDLQQEGDWRGGDTGLPLTWTANWKEGYPKNFGGRDCIQSSVDSGLFRDDYCTNLLCPVCQLSSEAGVFLLRGVCSQTAADRYYLMDNEGHFRGYIQTNIIFSGENHRWEMVDNTNSSLVMAHMAEDTFPVGLHRWYFSDGCSDPGQTFRSINLHLAVTQPGTFCCDDGECFDSELAYNLFFDCDDKTDENMFTFVSTPSSYDQYWPPVIYKAGKIELLKINATFTVINVFDINEEESYFGLDFIILMTWYDKDLTFQFLKNYEDGNTLYPETIEKIWHPVIDFEKKQAVIEDFNHKIFVSKESEACLRGEMDDIHVIEEYNGGENSLNLLLKKRIRFSCSYDNIKNYPFGTQTCNMKFYISGAANNLTRLLPTLLIDNGPKEFGRYIVKDWIMIQGTDGYDIDKNKIEVKIVLDRKIVNIFMVNFLPTILLNVINQSTNWITGYSKYELIVTVNITCMMVLASVYLSVANSLPRTSNIKPVEIWLLFNLAYPFLVILTNIVMQVISTNSTEVNIEHTEHLLF